MSAVTHLKTSRSTIRTISLDDITVDPVVQREEGLDQRRVNKMAANFDPDALGLFIVAQRRNNTVVCLDGMHRRAAAQQAGHKDHVDARVFTGLSLAEEAALFLLYNDKKDPSPISRFKARVIAEDPVAVAINTIIVSNGWYVRSGTSQPGTLAAVDAIERVYRNGHGVLTQGTYPALVDQTLAIITAAWGHDSTGVHQTMLGGIGQVCGRFASDVDPEKLVRELQDTRPRALIGRAKTIRDAQGGTVPAALAKILVGLHNKKRRTNLLPEWVWTR